MKNIRQAVILGTFAGAFYVAAVPPAVGEELSALDSNREPWQRRLEQDAQGSASAGVAAASGASPAAAPMVGGSFPRSFLLPGTQTSFRISGEIRDVAAYWFSGGIPNTSPQSTTVGATGLAEGIPLNIHVPVPVGTATATARARSTVIFVQSPAQSKLSLETRTPTVWGEARTFAQFDFAGSNTFIPGGSRGAQGTDDPLLPRLRFGYVTIGGLLVGQANSNFADPDASAQTIDFGGNFGEAGFTRIAQVRYTQPLAEWGILGALSVSAEAPETDAWTAGQGLVGSDAGATASASAANGPAINPTKASAPDLTAAWYMPYHWGHLDFSTVVRPGLRLKDGLLVDRNYIGYGMHVGGSVKPGWFGWTKDDITFQLEYGNGIGRYLASSSTFAILSNYPATPPSTAAAANNVIARTITEWGGSAGYQHLWLANLRSTISSGIGYNDLNLGGTSGICTGDTTTASARTTGTGGCGIDKMLVSAHANLVWNPVPFADLGVEYVYAHRVVLSNLKGDQHSILSRIRVEF